MQLSVALRHRFRGFTLDAEFAVPAAGVTALFGSSGSGKSTIIAAIAGLLRPDAGRIAIGDTVLIDTASGRLLPPERRRVGLVFQDARLFPHMRVATNLRYGTRRVPPGPIRFDEVVALLGIERLLDRRPRTLSGGERQRVAIGRALLAQPQLLLMDEPLASLDAARKAEILPYLARLRTALELPILYVTHALDEVVRLADTLVLIEAGRVLAAGPVTEIAARADLPLAQRDDAAAVLDCRIAAHDTARRLTRLDAAGTTVLVALLEAPPGARLRLLVPAREVILARAAPEAISVQNVLSGRVRALVDEPAHRAVLVEVVIGSSALLARLTPDAVERLELRAGEPVFALFKSMGVEILDQ